MNDVFGNKSACYTKVMSLLNTIRASNSTLSAYTIARLTNINSYAGTNGAWRKRHVGEFLSALEQVLTRKSI